MRIFTLYVRNRLGKTSFVALIVCISRHQWIEDSRGNILTLNEIEEHLLLAFLKHVK